MKIFCRWYVLFINGMSYSKQSNLSNLEHSFNPFDFLGFFCFFFFKERKPSSYANIHKIKILPLKGLDGSKCIKYYLHSSFSHIT